MKTMDINLLFTVISILSFTSSSCANGISGSYPTFYDRYGGELTKNYRLPLGEDLSYWGTDTNSYFYKSKDDEGRFKEPYWTKGDFNSDGITDRVYILFGNDNSAILYAFISTNKKEYKIIKVADVEKTMGASTSFAKDGKILLKSFHFEGHAVEYIWDASKSIFKKVN